MLDKAIHLAVTAHEGQEDKQGEPYILHPLRVMQRGLNEDERVLGVLHDTIEDGLSWYTLLKYGFPDHILAALDAITHRNDEPRLDYYERIKRYPLALAVKEYDMDDNNDPSRAVDDLDLRVRLILKYTIAREALGFRPMDVFLANPYYWLST